MLDLIEKTMGISKERVCHMLIEDLGIKKRKDTVKKGLYGQKLQQLLISSAKIVKSRLNLREKIMGISKKRFCYILIENLGMRKLTAGLYNVRILSY